MLCRMLQWQGTASSFKIKAKAAKSEEQPYFLFQTLPLEMMEKLLIKKVTHTNDNFRYKSL